MSGEFGVGSKLDSLVGGFGGHGGGIGNEERHDEFVPVAHDHSIKDVRAGLERVFDGLRGNEFACGGFLENFIWVGVEKMVFLVHVDDVSGVELTMFRDKLSRGV